MRFANQTKMQNSRENRGRADRREDARRQNREQENTTAYRPRTQRRTDKNDSVHSEDRERRARRIDERLVSGSYRPRTAKREFAPRHNDEDRAYASRSREVEEQTEPRENFYSERSRHENKKRNTRRDERNLYPRTERNKESNERRQRSEYTGEDKRNRKKEHKEHVTSFHSKGKRTYDREVQEYTERSDEHRSKTKRRVGRADRFAERGRKKSHRGEGRITQEELESSSQTSFSQTPRGRRRRFEERIASATPVARLGRRVMAQRGDYFEGLDSELMGRKPRRELRGEKKSKGRKNESYAAVRENRRKETTVTSIHTPIDLSQPMRLNRYIAHCGQCSRRDADEMITRGEIAVNGTIITTLGEKVIPANDIVTHKGEVLKLEQKVYILLNKPKDTFCTVEDEHAARTVLDLVKDACSERIYPVGRLDRNTTGLLLLTNDGDLTEKLTHPSYAKRKTYEVTLDRKVTPQDMEQLRAGITLEDDTFVQADEIAYVRPDDNSTVGITIHTGQNRVVRRMFDSLGFRVERLDRVLYAGLTKRNLPRGTWRFLTDEEIRMLKNDSYR